MKPRAHVAEVDIVMKVALAVRADGRVIAPKVDCRTYSTRLFRRRRRPARWEQFHSVLDADNGVALANRTREVALSIENALRNAVYDAERQS